MNKFRPTKAQDPLPSRGGAVGLGFRYRGVVAYRVCALVFAGLVAVGGLAGCSTDNQSAGLTGAAFGSESTSTSPVPSVPLNSGSEMATSTEQTRSRFVIGLPAPGLNFTVPSSTLGATAETVTPLPLVSVNITDQQEAISSFATSVVSDDYRNAFALLSESDRTQIGSPAKFGELLAQAPSWTSFSVAAVSGQPIPNADGTGSALETVTAVLTVKQQPSVSEIRGVVGPSATLEFALRDENGGWHIVWRRHKVTQNFVAAEARLVIDVGAWADGQRACASNNDEPIGQYNGGLVGEVWLAKTICGLPSPVTVENVGDFDSITDPQAIVDAFGGDAYRWARIVKVLAPTPFHVIAAPLGDHWVVVGLSSIF